MSGQFTPGPWLFGLSNRNNEAAIIGDIDSVVCYLPDATTGCAFKPADARLIAAAPMLLEKVRQYANECGGCDGTGLVSIKTWVGGIEVDNDDQPCPDCADIRAAIAAATGETK